MIFGGKKKRKKRISWLPGTSAGEQVPKAHRRLKNLRHTNQEHAPIQRIKQK